jgi:hypothetical protein
VVLVQTFESQRIMNLKVVRMCIHEFVFCFIVVYLVRCVILVLFGIC